LTKPKRQPADRRPSGHLAQAQEYLEAQAPLETQSDPLHDPARILRTELPFTTWPESPIRSTVLGLDLGIRRDRSALAVCDLTLSGLAIVRELCIWTPSRLSKVDLQEVEETATMLAKQWGAPIVIDPHEAELIAHVVGRRQRRPVRVHGRDPAPAL